MKRPLGLVICVAAVVVFFAVAEGVSRIFIPPGSYDYIERRAIEQNLTHKKAKGEYRILFYGESTMHGNQLYPKSTIDKWLRLYLAELLPENISYRIKTANFGRLGAGSSFIADSFIETIPYKPDLAVFYIAHNDFTLVPHRRALFTEPSLGRRIEKFFGNLPKISSFINLLNRAYIKYKINRKRRIAEEREPVDKWYSESPGRYYTEEDLLEPQSEKFAAVKENFEQNINRIIKAAEKNRIPVIFFEAVAKWKGYEPVEPGGGPALEYYKKAESYERNGKPEEANYYYALANDEDLFPIRAPSCVNRFYESVREKGDEGVYVIRTQAVFEKNSKTGIVGDELILDPVHPTIKGQAVMALEIARVIYEEGLFAPGVEWGWDEIARNDKVFIRLKEKLNFDEDSEFTMYLTSAQYVEKRYDKAAEFLEKALEIKPDSVYARSWLDHCYSKIREKKGE